MPYRIEDATKEGEDKSATSNEKGNNDSNHGNQEAAASKHTELSKTAEPVDSAQSEGSKTHGVKKDKKEESEKEGSVSRQEEGEEKKSLVNPVISDEGSFVFPPSGHGQIAHVLFLLAEA